MDEVIVFFTSAFPPDESECAAYMRLVADHAAAAGVADGLQAVPFNCFGFGLFPPGRAADLSSPFIGIWYDDPYPLYWIQIRASQDLNAEVLACELCFGAADAIVFVREFIPRLLDLAARSNRRTDTSIVTGQPRR